MFDKHKNNIVVFVDFGQVKKDIVILLTLSKSKKYCHFADFEQVIWMTFNL